MRTTSEPQTAPESSADTLRSALRAEVQPTTFKKGREYAEEDRVLGWREDGSGRRGEVLGSNGETYHCEVSVDGAGALHSTCDCPAWDKYGPHCKHVVAVGLADKTPAPGAEPVRVAEIVPLPSLAKLESWLGLSAAGEPAFVYRLSPAQPRAAGRSWLFDVRRRDGRDGGPIAVKRFLSVGTRLAPADERVFTELARHESRFDGRSEERRVGKECRPLCRSRWSPYH